MDAAATSTPPYGSIGPITMSFVVDVWQYLLEHSGHNYFLLFTVYGTIFATSWYILINIPFLLIEVFNLKALQRYKIQQNKQANGQRILDTLPIIALNSTIVSVLTAIPFYLLGLKTGVHFGTKDLPSVSTLLRDIVFSVFIEEIGFYYSHRLFHVPFFYKPIHKQHHRWTAPISITSIYCHPIEHAVSNLAPLMLGPTLLGSHCIVFWIWFMIAITSTTFSHCGYDIPFLPSGLHHDYHHAVFTENFGVLGILDTLHGTNKTYRAKLSKNAKQE